MQETDLASTHNLDITQLESILGPDAWKLTPATLAYKISGGEWVPAKHLLYISSIVAFELHRGNARIIISMPPRHGKSELFSIYTPIWYLDKWPHKQVMAISYGADLAEEFGQRVRDTIIYDADVEEGAHLLNPLCYVRKDSKRVDRFLTVSGGGMRSVGIGGSVYGRGADLLLIDDYYKNLEEARSEVKRKSIFDWVVTVAASRVQSNGSVIITATRWGTDDLSAEMLRMTGSKYKEIRLPAFAEENDPLGRAVGEPLWSDFYDEERLTELKNGMGSFLFNALYQQSPKLASSDIFQREWIKIVDKLPHHSALRSCRSWDLAGTEGAGDYTAGPKCFVEEGTNNFYIADMIHVQKSPGKVEQIVEEIAENDGIATAILIEQEPGSSGKSLVERYIKKLTGYVVKAIHHTGDKLVRALPFFAAAERGNVYLLRGNWNDKFLDECVQMPNGVHDDQVDAVSQAFNYFFGKKKLGGSWGRGKRGATSEKADTVAGAGKIGITWGKRRR